MIPLLTQFHVDKKGRVNFAQTELLIHVVNRDTNRILDVDRWVCAQAVCLPPCPGVGEGRLQICSSPKEAQRTP